MPVTPQCQNNFTEEMGVSKNRLAEAKLASFLCQVYLNKNRKSVSAHDLPTALPLWTLYSCHGWEKEAGQEQ